MSTQSHHVPQIERLKGRDNYDDWKFAVQAYFEHEGLWKCVLGTETDADKLTKAKSRIILLIEPSNYAHVKSAKTAKEAWDKLNAAFEDNGLNRKVGLLRILTTTKLNDSTSVDEYVNTIVNTAHKLKGIGMDISEEWIGTLLLSGLPDKYSPMIMGIESSGVSITADSIKTKILQDVKTDSECLAESTAMFSKHKSKKSTNNRNKTVRCYECNKYGHFSNQCPEKKVHSSNIGALYTSCMASSVSSDDVWVVDSGCSGHMTKNKQYLENVSAPNVKEVIVADNSRLRIDCVGDVRLDLPATNSNEKANVLVKNVQYVPNLCTNLLSVSQMIRNGNTVSFDKKGCSIKNDKGHLIASASLTNNLYKLDTVSRSECYISTTGNEKMSLWHRRLGHIGQQNLKRLPNGIVNGISFSSTDFEQ